MIVPTMSPEEIFEQMERDFGSVLRKSLCFSNLKRMEMMRNRLKRQTLKTRYKTKLHNEWNIISRLTTESIGLSYYIESEDRSGKIAYQIGGFAQTDAMLMLRYNAHFFSRYREREELEHISPNQVVARFFKNNWENKAGVTEVDKSGALIVNYVFKEGVGVGAMNAKTGITTMRTYLPHFMLNNKQKNRAKHIALEYEEMCKIAEDDQLWEKMEKLLTQEEMKEVATKAL
ncbi:MAG: hypothetical protein IPP77_01785 [Bacteroidetes bacterium]|nr:hypothetical protein [Bacteroidota bacterium]